MGARSVHVHERAGLGQDGTSPACRGAYELSAKPGEYEFKLLWTNHLARSIKFTATPGGKLDNGSPQPTSWVATA